MQTSGHLLLQSVGLALVFLGSQVAMAASLTGNQSPAPATSGQTLTIKSFSMALNDPEGNCTLLAASLSLPPTGTLSGVDTFLPSGAVVNLTREGILDWAHWGLATVSGFNHNAGAAPQISNVTPIGAGTVSQMETSPAVFSWINGAPTLASTNSAGLSAAGEGSGFQFTVPADATTKVLRVYVSAYSAHVHFEAALSDGSAPIWSNDSFDATANVQGPVRVYVLSYAAVSAGQTLTVKASVLVDEGSGWVSLHAATLQALAPQTGTLGGGFTVLATASTVNLTDEGNLDWAHWGINAATDVDRKMGGTNVLSDFHVIGFDASGAPLEVQQFGDNFTAYSWSNGSPTASVTSTGTGIYLAQPGGSGGPGLNSGFELSVPADLGIRALKVYVGAYACRMHFEAHLSDGSAPAYIDESFFNEGDGPNRVYTLTFAAAAPSQTLTVRWWTLSLVDTMWGNVTLQSAALREAAPIVSLVTPINGSIFNSASSGLRFTASTIEPFSIAPGQVGLALNGSDLSSGLVVSGTAIARSALSTNLPPNRLFTGQIWAIDNLRHATTNFVTFDTFSTNGAVVIEAEDYNHENGLFLDNPAPGAYAGLPGAPDIDFHTISDAAGSYRPVDPVQIVTALETRGYFSAAGMENHAVTGWNPEDWLNYTRSFSNAKYQAYLRYGALMEQSVVLDLVTSDRAQPNQTLTPLGVFLAPQINSEAIYRYAPLTDPNGNAVSLSLSGVQTLRLTGANVAPGGGGLIADFIILVPATEQSQPRLAVSSGGGQITISFPTETGLTYTLESNNDLKNSAWQSLSPTVSGDGTVKSVSQPLGPSSLFYRVNIR